MLDSINFVALLLRKQFYAYGMPNFIKIVARLRDIVLYSLLKYL